MPFVQVASGSSLFYAVPTCLGSSEDAQPKLDPAKPTLFFIHTVACDSRMWSNQFENVALNTRFNMVTVDLHFHGLTKTPKDWKEGAQPLPIPAEGEKPSVGPLITFEEQAEDLADLVQKLDLRNIHFVGCGINTEIGYKLLLSYPHLFTSAVIISPSVLDESEHAINQFLDIWRFYLGHNLEDRFETLNACYSLFFGPYAANDARRLEWYHRWDTYAPTEEMRSYTFAQWMSAIVMREPIPTQKAREGFTMPLCIVSGTEHFIHPTAHGELLRILYGPTKCPFYESHQLGNAPGMLPVSHADEVSTLIFNWVCRVEQVDVFKLLTKKPDGSAGETGETEVCTTGFNEHWTDPYEWLEERLKAVKAESQYTSCSGSDLEQSHEYKL